MRVSLIPGKFAGNAIAAICFEGAQLRSGGHQRAQRFFSALASWLGVEHRCVAPFTSFSENEKLPDG
jgi:hypothetical protein